MVNASLNWASICGIVLFVFGLVIFFVRREIKKPTDLILIVSLHLSGGILFFQGWRLDPILQFSTFLLSVQITLIMYENIQLRNRLLKLKRSPEMNTSKAKRFHRNIGMNSKEDLEVMEDKQVYEIVKLQLLLCKLS